MSKDKMKNLLNEGTIRRFMKLAEIETLSDDFVETLAVEDVQKAEEAIEEGHYGMPKDDDDPAEATLEEEEVVDEAAHEDAPAEDEEADEPMDEPMMDEPAAEGADLAADLARGMAAVIEDVLGVSVAVEDGEAAAEPAELDMDVLEEPGLPEPEGDEPLDPPLDPPMMEEDELDMEALTREVTERVTARLQKEGRQEKMAEDLAERIIQRLKNQ